MSDTSADSGVPPQTPPTTGQRSNSGGGSGAVHPASSGGSPALATPVVSPSKPLSSPDAATAATAAAAASDLEQRIIHSALLMRGRSFLKFGRTGRPHLDVVRLSLPPAGSANQAQGQAVMMWGKKSVPLSELIAVTPGRVGPVFERFDAASGVSASELETLSALSFSMVFTSRSLDLQIEYTAKKASVESVARGEAERNAWVAACKWLLATSAAAGSQGAVAATILAPSPGHHALQTPSSQPSTPGTTPLPLLRATSQPSTPNPLSLSAASSASAAAAGTPPRNPDFSSASHLDSSSSGSPLQSLIVSPTSAGAGPSQCLTPFSPAVGGSHTGAAGAAGAAAISSSTAGASTSASSASASASGSAADSASGISRPLNVIRTTHVQSGFLWQRERLDEDFQLVRKLGEGAFAEVWLGRHKVLGFAVAVKTILLSSDPKRALKEKEEIADEIAVLRLCRNKFICGYVGCCLTPDKQGRIWILMDHFSRGSILNLSFQAGLRLNESQISYVIHSVLMGLIYLNSRNICHRDVKGRNILCNERGDIVLADFGVSKILRHGSQGALVAAPPASAAAAGESKDKDGQFNMANIAGSPCFMAPEVVSGSPASFAADVWSVGIVCLELANGGRVPHDDLTTPYRIFRAIKTTVPTLDWVPSTPLPSGAAPPPLALSPTTTPGSGGAFSAASSSNTAPATAVWSHSFYDFVRLCLDPNPATRSDAVSLLSHPFVSGSFSPAVMAPLLKAFDAAEHKRAKALAKRTALETKQQLQQQSARPPSAAAASSAAGAARSPARPSILDSLFKFLGRKGPTSVQAKMQVQILQGAGTLDEMDEPPLPPSSAAGGKGDAVGGDSQGGDAGGVGDGTVVMNGGSDTVVMGGDSFNSGCTSSDTDDEGDDMHTAATSLAPTPSISIAPSPASSPMATAAVMLPSYGTVPEIPALTAAVPAAAIGSTDHSAAASAAAAAAAASASPLSAASIPASSSGSVDPMSSSSSSSALSLPHVDSSSSLASPSASAASAGLPPSGLAHRKSHSSSGTNLAAAAAGAASSAEVLLKCSAAQLAALCHEVGLDSKLASILVARAAAKFGTNVAVAAASSPSLGAKRASNAPAARKSQQQQPQQQPQSSQSLGRASPLTLDDGSDDHDAESPPSLFPGCTPNPALAESLITQLEYATVMVCGLSRNDLTALKRMTNAPAPVRMAIESVALVLGVAPYHVGGPATRKIGSRAKPVYDYWSSAQNVLTRPNFLTQLKSFDFRQLSPLIIDRLHEFGRLQPKEFTPEVVASASMPAGVLWAWTRAIYSYATLCLGYVPAGVAVDLANGNGHLELNALTLPANEEVITAGTIAAAGAAGTSSNYNSSAGGALTARNSAGSSATHTASTLSLLSPSAAQAGKLNRRGSAGALDPAVMAAATKLAAASAAAAAGGAGAGANGGSTHRRGTGGHGSQPTIVFSAASLLNSTAATAKDSVAPAPAAVMPLTSPVSAPAGFSGARRGSLGGGAKPVVRPTSGASAAPAAVTKPAGTSSKVDITVPAAAAAASSDGVSAASPSPATPSTPSTDAAVASSPAAAASKPIVKKTSTGEVLPVGSARRKLSHGGGGGGGAGSGRSLLVPPPSGAATARSTSASRAPKSGSASHKAKATTTTTAAANNGAATTRDRGSSASAVSSSAVPSKRNSLPPTHSKAATAASAPPSAAPKKA